MGSGDLLPTGHGPVTSSAQPPFVWPVKPNDAKLSVNFDVEADISATSTLNLNGAAAEEGVVLKSLENVEEPSLDPRIRLSEQDRPYEEELDENLAQRFSHLVFGRVHDKISEYEKDHEPIYIEFALGDGHNPINFPLRKKWAITAIACFSTILASCTSSSYNPGFASMIRDLNCTNFQATIGLSVYALGFGIVPLVTASFSEEFGRFPLYVGSGVGFLLMYMMIALSPNIQTVIIARFIQGACGSTGATMVGGTIADIWAPKERGLPMSIFALAAIGGTGFGPVYGGWIEMETALEWKWIQWIQMIVCGVYILVLVFVMKETRSSILLTRIAKKLRKVTGNHRYRARVEDERANLRTLIWISCTRPVHLLFTEPVVLSFSLWIGFAWGVLYCMIESIAGTFSSLHNFNIGEDGTVFMAMVIGSLLGFASNFYQEHDFCDYKLIFDNGRNFPKRGPEARLYLVCVAAILIPVGMFIYAWSAFKSVPWISLAIGITIFVWGIFIVYLAVFSYLADCYGPFASSALAGQSLARNLSGTAFPLFTTQMYKNLDYKWANTLFGCLAALMIPIPFVLFFFGPSIRKRSKFSRAVMESS